MRFENGYSHIFSMIFEFEICDSVISYTENNWNPNPNGTGIIAKFFGSNDTHLSNLKN